MLNYGDVEVNFEVEISWHSALKEFLLVKQSERLKPQTIRNYESTLSRFSEYCIEKGADTPAKVSKRLVRVFLAELSNKYRPGYINAVLSRLRGFYNFLCAEDYFPEYLDPTRRVKFVQKDQVMLVVFNDDEVNQLITVAGQQKNKFYATRDKLILMILADCGLRVHELCTLKNVDVTDSYIFIAEAKGNKQRMVYVTPTVAKQIVKYKRVRDAYFKHKEIPKNDWFFRNFRGEKMRNDGIQKLMKRLAQRCTIRPDVRVSPHTMRHWFAQSQLKNGVSIFTLSKLLGHSSINTTQVYLRGLADELIVQSAIETSPLLNMKLSKKEK